jgi:uncharacterized protein YndB with AHSA1/START domain
METSIETTSVEREITIAASPETIWEFLVDSNKATRWMGTSASLDPRPGGAYRVQVIPDNTAVGEFVELDPPRRLVYTWGWEAGGVSSLPPGSTTIEIELIPDGDGTRMLFAHRDLPTAEEVRNHSRGWAHYLGRLEAVASGGNPGPDPMLEREPTS